MLRALGIAGGCDMVWLLAWQTTARAASSTLCTVLAHRALRVTGMDVIGGRLFDMGALTSPLRAAMSEACGMPTASSTLACDRRCLGCQLASPTDAGVQLQALFLTLG